MGIMQTALSAMSAYDTMLSVIANNLANLNTPGYKSQSVGFQDGFYQTLRGASPPSSGRGGLNPVQIGTGTNLGGITARFTQGTFTTTSVPTDIAILGRGFFVLRNNQALSGQEAAANPLYSRDGTFRIDAAGNLVHAGTGTVLMGWMADASGNITSGTEPSVITLPTEDIVSEKTSEVRFSGNFDSRSSIQTSVTLGFNIYDSQGNSHLIEMTVIKSAANTWDWSATLNNSNVGSGTIVFDANGNWQSGTGRLTLNLTNGAETPQIITLDFTGLSQLAAETTAGAAFQDGLPPSTLEAISIDTRGVISGIFSNGISRALAQIAIAVFPNQEGLQRAGSNLFSASANSGLARFLPPGVGSAGLIQSGGLESSTVELAKELSQVLVAQRGFQAAARLVLAADDLIQETLNLRR